VLPCKTLSKALDVPILHAGDKGANKSISGGTDIAQSGEWVFAFTRRRRSAPAIDDLAAGTATSAAPQLPLTDFCLGL
jgi:hypothetical protein